MSLLFGQRTLPEHDSVRKRQTPPARVRWHLHAFTGIALAGLQDIERDGQVE
jgi:hypothetical protein